MIEKYNKLSLQAKSAIWFTICGVLQKGVSFITIPIFTRLMSTSDYGMYSLYNSWLQILTIVTSLYLYYGILSNAMIKYEKDRDGYISSMQGLTIIITGLLFLVYLAFHKLFNQFFGLPTLFVILMFVQLFVNPAIYYWLGKKRFDYQYKILVE